MPLLQMWGSSKAETNLWHDSAVAHPSKTSQVMYFLIFFGGPTVYCLRSFLRPDDEPGPNKAIVLLGAIFIGLMGIIAIWLTIYPP